MDEDLHLAAEGETARPICRHVNGGYIKVKKKLGGLPAKSTRSFWRLFNQLSLGGGGSNRMKLEAD